MGSEVIIVPSLFLMIAYVFYVMANAFTRRQLLRSTTEFQGKLLDRMGTVGEFSQFLNTEGGRRFLGTMSSDSAGSVAHQRVLRAFQSGIVMVCLGIGIFMYLGEVVIERDTYESVGFVGTVSAAVGLGLLISGYVSLKLSRRLGLINGKSETSASKEIAHSA
jgi:TRAP-type mannitol/chloroaromatic compound transport system permease large subunit